jgi:hypothetical protein
MEGWLHVDHCGSSVIGNWDPLYYPFYFCVFNNFHNTKFKKNSNILGKVCSQDVVKRLLKVVGRSFEGKNIQKGIAHSD